MIKKILIANRGEIACRIIKTCRRLGIQVAVLYSDTDEQARHVQMADEAFHIGPSPSRESYLAIDKIISVAKAHQVDAIHPGYGFLAENAAFAKACEDNHLIFIGPHSSVIATMGNKDKAKQLMEKAGVPVIPGYHDGEQDIPKLCQHAKSMGLPVMIKAAAGGGGKGMRIVHEEKDLESAMEGAKRESLKSFGDDTLILEKFLPQARHIEVQVFGDHHGNHVHLFERDCSVQRRHQKIIEEAPAHHIQTSVKAKLYEAALKAVRAINYTQAGTIEFLYTDDNEAFYFLEMNTRLQVEHPITEAITQQDLVEWQIKVAQGECLPLEQEALKIHGHAIEARIYAEDPLNDFLPSTGTLQAIFFPDDKDVRIDHGILEKDEIGIYYDPILAKVIAHSDHRTQAMTKLSHALEHFDIAGIKHNIRFLNLILAHEDFHNGQMHTHYLSQHLQAILSPLKERHFHGLAVAAYIHLLKNDHIQKAYQIDEPNSPWASASGWQMNAPSLQKIELFYSKIPITIEAQQLERGMFLTASKWPQGVTLHGVLENNTFNYEVDGLKKHAKISCFDNCIHVFQDGISEVYEHINEAYESASADVDATLVAPMPGIITNIWVKPGMSVKKGDKIMAMEAMKMEHTLSASTPGLVKTIFYKIGDQVDQGTQLFDFEKHG